jgi:hypothetical protein
MEAIVLREESESPLSEAEFLMGFWKLHQRRTIITSTGGVSVAMHF